MWRNRRNPIKKALSINGETFPNNSRLATAGRDALHCHPVSVATGRHGNWGGGELVAGEEGGGEDGKGTGTNRPRLAASDQAIVESLSASSLLSTFFDFTLFIYSLVRQRTGVFSCEYYHNRWASLINMLLTLLLAVHNKYYISAAMANVWHCFQ